MATKPETFREAIERISGQRLGRTNPMINSMAKKSGVSAETIYRCALGDKPISATSARAVSAACKGAISPITILALDQPAKKATKK